MIIFIHGPDTFRSQGKLQEIIASFHKKRDKSQLNVVKIDGTDFSFDKFRQEVMTQGFLSPRKMVVTKSLATSGESEVQEQVLEFLKKDFLKRDDSNVLVFYETKKEDKRKKNKLLDFLKKQEYVYEFPHLQGARLENWIIKRVEERGGRIRKDGARLLSQLLGPDTWQLAQEIDKLVAYQDGAEINVEAIDKFVSGKFEANIFALTDAIASQNRKKALGLLTQELDNGASELYLLSMIARQYRILLQIKDLLDSGQSSAAKIAKDLKLHPFVVQKSIPPAKKYTLPELKAMHERLLETDLRLKSTSLNPKLLLDLLIVN